MDGQEKIENTWHLNKQEVLRFSYNERIIQSKFGPFINNDTEALEEEKKSGGYINRSKS